MSDIERKARELLAAEQDQHGRCQTSEALAAIKKALTPPEGYVLVPVEPTEEMLKVGYSWMMGRIVMRSLYDELLAARPEAQ